MPISGIEQPQIIDIDGNLRLRKYSDDCAFALAWYQDEETLLLVDGAISPYTEERMYRMYHYLRERGEVYFIEHRAPGDTSYTPIGDVTFWQDDMPIVIGEKSLRGQGIGKKVINALIQRAKDLGFTYLKVAEIYNYNIASQKLFESCGFKVVQKTGKGHSFELLL